MFSVPAYSIAKKFSQPVVQVSTDLRSWNDAHMHSRAKVHHYAVLTKGNCPICFLKVFLEVFFRPRHQVRNKIDVRGQHVFHSHLLLAAVGLPKLGHVAYGTRSVQMTTMHSTLYRSSANVASSDAASFRMISLAASAVWCGEVVFDEEVVRTAAPRSS